MFSSAFYTIHRIPVCGYFWDLYWNIKRKIEKEITFLSQYFIVVVFLPDNWIYKIICWIYFSFLWGYVGDVKGKGFALFWACICASAVSLAFGFSKSFWWAVSTRFLLGACGKFVSFLTLALDSTWFSWCNPSCRFPV